MSTPKATRPSAVNLTPARLERVLFFGVSMNIENDEWLAFLVIAISIMFGIACAVGVDIEHRQAGQRRIGCHHRDASRSGGRHCICSAGRCARLLVN